MLAGAAGSRAWMIRAMLADRHGLVAPRVPMGYGVLGGVLHHLEADHVVELVHAGCVIGQPARWSALEDDDGKRAASRDLLRHQEASPSASDNHDIHRFETCHRDGQNIVAIEVKSIEAG